MDQTRTLLYGLLFLIGFLIWQAWHQEHPQQLVSSPTTVENEIPQLAADTPASSPSAMSATQVPLTSTTVSQNLIKVETDTLALAIDPKGGDIVKATLKNYRKSGTTPKQNEPLVLLSQQPNKFYTAQSRLITNVGPDSQQRQAVYQSDRTFYEMAAGQKTLKVKLTTTQNGVQFNKTYTFNQGEYTIGVDYDINNQSAQTIEGKAYFQLKREPDATHDKGVFAFRTFMGGAYSSDQKNFQKVSFTKMKKEPLAQSSKGGWVAMMQHYFLGAWVPEQNTTNTFYTHVYQDKFHIMGMATQTFKVNSGQQKNIKTQLYIGPEIARILKTVAPHLELTVDYGILWPISQLLFFIMIWLHQFVGNWGWSIVLLTILIKACFYKLSAASYRSMSRLKTLQPKMTQLKERYGDDREKMGRAMMELYKKEKINPLGGCLPILVQIPFFIALYYVLMESVELRQSPFILWIHDLSIKDPFYILPLLMGASMLIQQKLSPAPPDPVQAKVMMIMPIMFTVLFMSFPAGLVLYWVVNNSLSILQQWWITKRLSLA